MTEPYYHDERAGITIYHGDCREVLPTLEVSADALVTDPPFCIANEMGTQERLDGKRSLQFAWDKFCTPEIVCEAIGMAMDLCHDKAGAFVFCGSDQVGPLTACFRDHDFTPKMAAWVKKCPPPAMPGNWWPSGFTLAFYGYRPGAWFGDDDPKRSNVFVHDTYRHGQPGKVNHPTQAPLALMSRIVRSVVPPDGMCIDPFMGSGTTLRAAKDLGRRAIGIELEEGYCEIAANRLRQEVLF